MGRVGRRLERTFLGLMMTALAFVVERRLMKSLKKKR
jgi:hypothetical protein